jgi:hypothetical protein
MSDLVSSLGVRDITFAHSKKMCIITYLQHLNTRSNLDLMGEGLMIFKHTCKKIFNSFRISLNARTSSS